MTATACLQPGDEIEIQGRHADGLAYRWWNGVVERCTDDEIAVLWPAGTRFSAPDPAGRKLIRTDCRMFFWPGRLYTLVEQYGPKGLVEIAMDIATNHGIHDGRCVYTDHELDVVMPAGREPFVEDEDEFAEAVNTYGYTPEFQSACYAAVEEALDLIRRWRPRGRPDAGLLARVSVDNSVFVEVEP